MVTWKYDLENMPKNRKLLVVTKRDMAPLDSPLRFIYNIVKWSEKSKKWVYRYERLSYSR